MIASEKQSLPAFIGFGEAGQAFAVGCDWRAFDVKDKLAECKAAGVVCCSSLADAVSGAQAIISLVTADQAAIAAQNAAQHIAADALYFDMNSVAPDTKRAAAVDIEAAGGCYVDVAVMSPVQPARQAVPLLVSGPHADAGVAMLGALGFTNVRAVGDDVGRASTIKMLRSVMYKGVEALTAECLIACERAGVTDEVLASFGNDWSEQADYRLDRMIVHGLRRSAEMYESSQTLLALGVSPMLTEGTVGWQQAMGELEISPVPDGLKAKLAAILEKMP
jgi:3-hydroxyisobutyrate dehydrogenase-like beta-hydroxyacid dehydrogenase